MTTKPAQQQIVAEDSSAGMAADVGLDAGAGAVEVAAVAWQSGQMQVHPDWVVQEVPVAFEVNGISLAVMLATPADLEDYAIGLACTEGWVRGATDVLDLDVQQHGPGWCVAMQINARSFEQIKDRRRMMAGRTGCGLCGAESLEQVLRPARRVQPPNGVAVQQVLRAHAALAEHQALAKRTGGAHAAAWCSAKGEVQVLREDVGRHNALDKLVGALLRSRLDAAQGFIAVTSRASYEMVYKAAAVNVGLLAAVSAPTQLAIEMADRAGLALLGFTRGERTVIYTQADRLLQR